MRVRRIVSGQRHVIGVVEEQPTPEAKHLAGLLRGRGIAPRLGLPDAATRRRG